MYIKREDAMEVIYKLDLCLTNLEYFDHNDLMKAIPAADVVEVRHGRWEKVIPTKSAAKWSTKVSCSQCHGQGYERYNYCPNCGAIMDLVGE